MSGKLTAMQIVLVGLLATGQAMAGRTWVLTPIEPVDVSQGGPGIPQPISSPRVGIGMRSQNTWPVVTYTAFGDAGTAMMTPVGWVGQSSGMADFMGSIGAATSPNGTVGFAYASGGFVSLGKSGWAVTSYNGQTEPLNARPAVAYRSDNLPSVLHNNQGQLTLAVNTGFGWLQDPITEFPGGATVFANAFGLAYDSFNQPNIVYSDGGSLQAALKFGGTWLISDVLQNPGPAVDNVDMAMTEADVPWIAYAENTTLNYGTYNQQTNMWDTGNLGTLFSTQGHFAIASDGAGGVGFTYVNDTGMLVYNHFDTVNGWEGASLIAPAVGSRDVDLVFDAQNFPVIIYTDGNSGNVTLAYDPVVVPEPVTALLLMAGVGLLGHRRSR